MKVLQSTPDRLVLRHLPLGPGLIKRKPGDLFRNGRVGSFLSLGPRVWRATLVHRNGHAIPL
jgi:hypothetical protein